LAETAKRRSSPELKVKMSKVVSLLVQGHTVPEVSEATGIKRSTIHSWRDREDFQALLDEAAERASEALITEGVHQTTQRMKDLGPLAAEVIARELESTDPKVRLQAAGMVMRYGGPSEKVQMTVGIERTLQALGSGDPIQGD
jgi:hypothetical protein